MSVSPISSHTSIHPPLHMFHSDFNARLTKKYAEIVRKAFSLVSLSLGGHIIKNPPPKLFSESDDRSAIQAKVRRIKVVASGRARTILAKGRKLSQLRSKINEAEKRILKVKTKREANKIARAARKAYEIGRRIRESMEVMCEDALHQINSVKETPQRILPAKLKNPLLALLNRKADAICKTGLRSFHVEHRVNFMEQYASLLKYLPRIKVDALNIKAAATKKTRLVAAKKQKVLQLLFETIMGAARQVGKAKSIVDNPDSDEIAKSKAISIAIKAAGDARIAAKTSKELTKEMYNLYEKTRKEEQSIKKLLGVGFPMHRVPSLGNSMNKIKDLRLKMKMELSYAATLSHRVECCAKSIKSTAVYVIENGL